mmetsp:Transcript_20319/g.47478  ORF Transcript_20319/g.47478 Transcript_20319/m.47478 type:complete len:244 (+) Transcript_20319:3-734(+)
MMGLFLIVCVAVWLAIKKKNIDYGDVGASYQNFAVEKQYWRMWTASFSHISVMHLALNMSSLWAYRFIEQQIGTLMYLKLTFLFVVVTIWMMMGMYHLLIVKLGREASRRTVGVGYSCVIFAWMTWTTVMHPMNSLDLGFFSLPLSLAPFGNLIFTSLIVPNASFVGHLAGILAGYAVGFGALSWVTDYWFFQIMLWMVILVVMSLKTSRVVDIPWITIEDPPPELPRVSTSNMGRSLGLDVV